MQCELHRGSLHCRLAQSLLFLIQRRRRRIASSRRETRHCSLGDSDCLINGGLTNGTWRQVLGSICQFLWRRSSVIHTGARNRPILGSVSVKKPPRCCPSGRLHFLKERNYVGKAPERCRLFPRSCPRGGAQGNQAWSYLRYPMLTSLSTKPFACSSKSLTEWISPQ